MRLVPIGIMMLTKSIAKNMMKSRRVRATMDLISYMEFEAREGEEPGASDRICP